MNVSERINILREKSLNTKPSICAERAVLITEAYKKYKDEPLIIKRAKALRYVLENMTIYIKDEELIVGNQASKPGRVPVFPETQSVWVSEQLNEFEKREEYRYDVEEKIKKSLKKLLPYWNGKTISEKVNRVLPKDTKKILEMQYPVISANLHLTGGIGHVLPDYSKILTYGVEYIKKEIHEQESQLNFTQPESINKLQFFRATKIICDSIVNFARRYSFLALKMSLDTEDNKRKKELIEISKICKRVPLYAASNLYEALQSFWIVHLVLAIEADGRAVSPGRFDQYIYPYYKNDLLNKSINKEFAQELVDSLWIKFNEVQHLANVQPKGKYCSGFTMSQNIVLGGITSNGKDATNDFSYVCLNSEKNIRFPQPSLSIRLHNDTPNEFLIKSLEVIKLGGGKPAIFNDELIIPSLLNDGVSLNDARNYGIVGCVEPAPINSFAWTNAAMFNLAKCLELAIYNGKDILSGNKINNITEKGVNNFIDVWENYKKQVAYFVKHMVIILNAIQIIHKENLPLPFLSILVDDCIKKGIDITEGGATYNYMGPQGVGLPDVSDSFSALKKIVFEDKSISFDKFMDILKDNFDGNERIRQKLINKTPKYGNDDEYVDDIAKQVAHLYTQEVRKYNNSIGGKYRPGLYSVASHVPAGQAVGALPNGRKSSEGLVDGISPVQGCDKNGLTAIVNSASKLDQIFASNGTNLNPKLHPSCLSNSEDIFKFITFLRCFVQSKNMHIQFNVVTNKMLYEAQKNPDEYKSLLIRVSGYSAFFVELNKEIQNDIIRRTEHLSE
ncbi:MAG: glycyl radical protein [Eubacteriaceae bacterium]